MRVAIAGAGNVGQSIARSLLATGHKVLLIERRRERYRPSLVPGADWMLADACELSTLQEAGIETANVVIAATGEDRSNLVFAMLCKREFAVPRVVARINELANQWLFDEQWGVDVAVSTPSSLASAVEEAVITGEVVRLMTLQQSQGSIVGITLPENSEFVGKSVAEIGLPPDAALLAITRDKAIVVPDPNVTLLAGDELVLLVGADSQDSLRARLLSGPKMGKA